MHKPLLLAAAIFFSPAAIRAQNLLANGSAESSTAGNWTMLAAPNDPTCFTTANWRVVSGQISANAQSGSALFFPGCNSSTGGLYKLYQDVPMSSRAAMIDASGGYFTFDGFYSGWNQTNPDQVRFTFEYRDATNALLGSNTSGFMTTATNNSSTQSPWAQYVYTMLLPTGTRTVRVLLEAQHNTGTAIDAYFDNLSLADGAFPLALTLTSFSAEAKGGAAHLVWTDAHPAESRGYNVDWSTDGTSWQTLDFLPSSTSASQLSFFHREPVAGKNFYRIASLSSDSTLDYSTTASVVMNAGNESTAVAAWPVPAQHSATVSGLTRALAGTTAVLADAQGRAVAHIVLDGKPTVTVLLSSYVPGLYTLRLADGQVVRLVKE